MNDAQRHSPELRLERAVRNASRSSRRSSRSRSPAMTTFYRTWVSPFGELQLAGDKEALHLLCLPGRHRDPEGWTPAVAPFEETVEQLGAYFAGARTTFDLPLAPHGSAWDRAVWALVAGIPYGETRSYAELARALLQPDRARAVGGANARNPLPIIVPCHRVIGSDGSLTGYGGGLALKARLLALEAPNES